MATNLKLSNATVDAEGDALAPLFNNGYLRIYEGTIPADADTALGAQVLLAELRFAATGIATSVNGVLTANALTEHVEAARLAGADRHLAKPFSAEDLLGLLTDLPQRAAEAA